MVAPDIAVPPAPTFVTMGKCKLKVSAGRTGGEMIANNNLVKRAALSVRWFMPWVFALAAIAPFHTAEGQQTPQGHQAVSENDSPREIGDQWLSSSEYQEFLSLGGERSEKAKSLKEATITRITQEELRLYTASFESKYQSHMGKKIEGLPLGLSMLLANMNLKLRPLLVGIKSPQDISRFNTYLYQYVESVGYEKGIAKTKIDRLIALFPELQGKKIIEFLTELASTYDAIAKTKADIAQWDEIIRKLEALEN